MDELFFLISLTGSPHEGPVQYDTSSGQWHQILAVARANGWEPQGTILDYEFQYQLEMSLYDDFTHAPKEIVDQKVTDKCENWHGGYFTPEYQVVTNDDAEGLRKALEKGAAPVDLLSFLSYGAFRITR